VQGSTKKGARATAGFLALMVALFLTLSAAPAAESRESFANLVEKVSPAVVNIAATVTPQASRQNPPLELPPELRGTPFGDYLERFFGQPSEEDGEFPRRSGPFVALGSGFLIDPSGYIATNGHVVKNAEAVQVTLADGRNFQAKIVGADDETDIALLKIDAEGLSLPYLTWGDSKQARVGDWVLAVGNPFGLGGTVTAGIISPLGRDIQTGRFDDFLQIDAPINRGNSGGPLFDTNGFVIGINTAIFSNSGGSIGIGFATPSAIARSIVDELRAHGRVDRGWLGVQVQGLTKEIAEALGLVNTAGALVIGAVPNSPADRARILQGDVILSANGRPVVDSRDLVRIVSALAPAKKILFDIWRDGKRIEVTAELGRMPETSAATSKPQPEKIPTTSFLGLALQPLTQAWRRRLGVRETTVGVVVADVERGSPAELAGFVPDDLILKIGALPVSEPAAVVAAVRSMAESGRQVALILVQQAGTLRYLGLSLEQLNKPSGRSREGGPLTR
jgi:serine protease Do